MNRELFEKMLRDLDDSRYLEFQHVKLTPFTEGTVSGFDAECTLTIDDDMDADEFCDDLKTITRSGFSDVFWFFSRYMVAFSTPSTLAIEYPVATNVITFKACLVSLENLDV